MNPKMTWMVTGAGVNHIDTGSPCYSLPELPPPSDHPVFVDALGRIYTWGSVKWKVGTVPLNFGYEPSQAQTHELTVTNGELLKRCIAWFIWGDRRTITANTLGAYFTNLKRVFAACSGLNVPIDASELSRYFDTIKPTLAAAIRPSTREQTISRLNELWHAREWLGFELLTPPQIASLRELVPNHEGQQHHFIPPRIWAYQAGRMRQFLEEVLEHKVRLKAMLDEVTDAYRTNYGSLSMVAASANDHKNPCQQWIEARGCVYLGSFCDLARRHNVAQFMERWMFAPGATMESLPTGVASVRLLSQLLNLIGMVGTAYVQCLSGVRIAEAMSLRCNCLSVENDSLLGEISVLSGETTKTTQDADARWITVSSARLAVDAMEWVARWRTAVAIELDDIPLTETDRENPYLVQRTYEPWGAAGRRSLPPVERPSGYDISSWRRRMPRLFDLDDLRITPDDELYVARFSANASIESYGSGCIWHFTSHQYRRTMQVMMAASGVSLPTRQHQLQHLRSAQSAYYANGFQNLRLNRSFGDELVSTRYELVAVEAGLVGGPDYVSPFGEERKSALLSFFSTSSRDEITAAQKKGFLTIKQTVVGICTKRYCEYGGHDNYAHCPECVDGLMDRRKREKMAKEGRTIAARLVDVPSGTPLHASLQSRANAVKRFLDVTD